MCYKKNEALYDAAVSAAVEEQQWRHMLATLQLLQGITFAVPHRLAVAEILSGRIRSSAPACCCTKNRRRTLEQQPGIEVKDGKPKQHFGSWARRLHWEAFNLKFSKTRASGHDLPMSQVILPVTGSGDEVTHATSCACSHGIVLSILLLIVC